MTEDKALDLAQEALKLSSVTVDSFGVQRKIQEAITAITAIKQARALDKMAENARELGLDYEPVASVQEDWGPGPHEYHSLTAAQRQWVGLTDEEVRETISSVRIEPLFSYLHVARAIEAKLKEKNT